MIHNKVANCYEFTQLNLPEVYVPEEKVKFALQMKEN